MTDYIISSYIDNLNDSIVKRFKIDYVVAGYLMFIPYGIAALISFILGLILQKKPKLRRKLILSSTIIQTIGLFFVFILPNVNSGDNPTSLHYIVIAIQFLTVSYAYAMLFGVVSSSIIYIVK